MAVQCARRVVAVGRGVLNLPVDLNQFGQLDSPEWSPAGHPGMQQQELHSTIEQHRAAQWARSINEIDEPFPHFKVAKRPFQHPTPRSGAPQHANESLSCTSRDVANQSSPFCPSEPPLPHGHTLPSQSKEFGDCASRPHAMANPRLKRRP